MSSIRDLDSLIGLQSIPSAPPPVLAGRTGVRATAAASVGSPLARAVAAPSRTGAGTTTLDRTVRIGAWVMLAVALANIAVIANMPFGFTDSMPFADIVNYTGFTTALATWWGNPALPIALSGVGALGLVAGAFLTDLFDSANQTGSMLVLGSLAAAGIGSLGTVLAVVLAVVAAIVSIAIAIAIGIAMVCVIFMILLGLLEG